MEMALKKEAIEISCASCNTNFRLWIPSDLLPEWGKSEEISCVKCGARYMINRGNKGLEVSSYQEPAPEAPVKEGVPQAGPAGKETILFVEDDKLATAIAQNTLAGLDMNIVTVKNAREALEKLDNGGVDLVVTDLHLINAEDPEADIDGEELLNKIVSKGVTVPSIITTGKEVLDDLVLDSKWFDLNVKGFIQKGNPFWAEDLRDKIKEVLKKD
jgi:CheY-like chemotaxis protein